MRKPLLGLVILFLAPALASGQTVNAPDRLWAVQPQAAADETGWSNLQQLRVGQKIEVVDTNLKKYKGTFLSFSDEAISLRVGKDEVGVQRPHVLRVSVQGGGRWKNALTGMVIGAGAGLLLGAIVDSNDDLDSSNGKIFAPLVFGGVGAGLGSIFPGFHTVYRAKGKRGGTQP
jgi:hypothetical protein